MALGLADHLFAVRSAFLTFLASSRQIRIDDIDWAFAHGSGSETLT
jgi:hypothetical protein